MSCTILYTADKIVLGLLKKVSLTTIVPGHILSTSLSQPFVGVFSEMMKTSPGHSLLFRLAGFLQLHKLLIFTETVKSHTCVLLIRRCASLKDIMHRRNDMIS